jgi:predicted nucleotidyltransferase
MNQTRPTRKRPEASSPYPWRVTMPAIRKLAREIAEKFEPEKIILFGSYAYGKPNKDSDVDLLVVMPARNEIDQAVRIRQAIDHPFPMDLLVRTPYTMKWRLEEGDWFLREIVDKGKVLHEKVNRRVGRKGRKRLGVGTKARTRKAPQT